MKCCFCGKDAGKYGNNPEPVNTIPGARCCDDCNYEYVIPARLNNIRSGLRPSAYERTKASVYATGNRWAIENFHATHN